MAELRLERVGEELVVTLGAQRHTLPWVAVAPGAHTEGQVLQDPIAYGRALCDLVFQGELAGALARLPPSEPLLLAVGDPLADAVPWEYMRDEQGLLAARWAVARYVEAPWPADPPRAGAPLELVAVPVAALDGPRALDTEREYRNLVAVVRDAGRQLRLVRVRPPTLPRLELALSPDALAVIHFMGHGGEEDGSALVFEDEFGRARAVGAAELLDVLVGDVFLVVLNSCLSAAGGGGAAGNIARALVRAQVPYALGSQFVLPDDGAMALSQALFGYLLRGRGVEDALRRTRRDLLRSGLPHREWLAGVPALYTQRREPAAPLRLAAGQATVQPDPALLAQSFDLSTLPEATHFVGRSAEIEQVLRLLLSPDSRSFVVLHGLGGVGKTALARAVAERVGWNYGDRGLAYSFNTFARVGPDGAVEVNAQFAPTFYTRLAQLYGIDTESKRFQEREGDLPVTLLQTILQLRRGTRSLLILDNLETLFDALERGVPEAQPLAAFVRRLGEGDGHVLLTTRTLPPPDWGRCEVVPVGGLSEPAGAGLFMALLDPDRRAAAPQADRRALALRLAGHPLSIRLLAARFNELTGDLAAFLANVEEELKRAEQDTPDDFVDFARQRTVYACLSYSVARLSEPERRALQAAALFQRFFTYETAGIVLGGPGGSEALLRSLVRLGLLERESRSFPDGPLVRLELHPVVRWYSVNHLPSPDEAARERYGVVLRDLADRVEEHFNQSGRLRAQIVDALPDFEQALAGAGLALGPAERAAIARPIAMVYFQLGQPRRAQELFELALEQQQLGDDRVAEALTQLGLGGVLLQQGRPDEALELFEAARARFEAAGLAARAAQALGHIATVMLYSGRPAEAVRYHREALAIYEGLGDRQRAASAKSYLAHSLVQLGEPTQALPLLREALALLEESRDAFAAAEAESGLATVLRQLWRSEEALHHYRKALQTFQQLGNKSQIASIQFAIAEVFVQLDRLDEAMGLYEQAQQTQQDLNESYALLTTRSGMSDVLLRQGRAQEAYAGYARVAADAERLGELRSTALAQSGMANAMQQMGDYQESAALFRTALGSAIRLGDRREVAIIQVNYSQTLYYLGDHGYCLRTIWAAYATLLALGFENDERSIREHILDLKRRSYFGDAFDRFWHEGVGDAQPGWLAAVEPNRPDLATPEQAADALLATFSWAHARLLVADQPAAFADPAVDELFAARAEAARAAGDAAQAEQLDSHRSFLAKLAQDHTAEAIRAFVNAPSWPETMAALERHRPWLAGPACEPTFEQFIEGARAEGDESSLSTLELHRSILAACLSGSEPALIFKALELGFASMEQFAAAGDALGALAAALGYAEGPASGQAPDWELLRLPAARRMVAWLPEVAAPEEQPHAAELSARLQDILAHADAHGLAAALADPEGAVAGQERRRELARQIRQSVAAGDLASFQAAAADYGAEAAFDLARRAILGAQSAEQLRAGAALLQRAGGELAEQALAQLLADAPIPPTQQLLAEALRAASPRGAEVVAAWEAGREPPEPVRLLIGVGLIPLFDRDQGGVMLSQIEYLRRDLAVERSLVLPPIRIQDSLWLGEHEVELWVGGEAVELGAVGPEERQPGRLAALLKGLLVRHEARLAAAAAEPA